MFLSFLLLSLFLDIIAIYHCTIVWRTFVAPILLSFSQGIRWRKWAPYLRLAGRGLRVVGTRYGLMWAWLAGRGRCTASRPEWLAGRNGSVRLEWGRSSVNKGYLLTYLCYGKLHGHWLLTIRRMKWGRRWRRWDRASWIHSDKTISCVARNRAPRTTASTSDIKLFSVFFHSCYC